MSKTQSSAECQRNCRVIAAVVGILGMLILYFWVGFSGFWAFLTGLVIGIGLAIFLPRYRCQGTEPAQSPTTAPVASEAPAPAAPTPAADAQEAAASASAEQAPAAPAPSEPQAAAAASDRLSASAAPLVNPTAALAGEAELASRKGTWKYEAGAPKPKAAPKAKKPAPAAKKAAPDTAVEEKQPEVLYSAPPAEGADDLKLISGVGPKLEQTLNGLGIYRFDQVASWGPSDIAWVDKRLRFKGRIARDDWMSQAKTLAAGGETEFSAKKKK